MARINKSTVLIGRKGVGKSTYLERQASVFAKKTGKKALIIDVNGSPAYAKHQELNERQFVEWCRGNYGGVKRFYLSEHNKMWNMIAKYFRSGLIVFEDCTKYIDPNPTKVIKKLLVDHRMWDADMIFTFHALDFVPPFFRKMVSHLIVFKTNDNIDNRDTELSKKWPNWMAVKKVMNKVKQSKDQYKPEIIDLEV